jgi:hypothetical protein
MQFLLAQHGGIAPAVPSLEVGPAAQDLPACQAQEAPDGGPLD